MNRYYSFPYLTAKKTLKFSRKSFEQPLKTLETSEVLYNLLSSKTIEKFQDLIEASSENFE